MPTTSATPESFQVVYYQRVSPDDTDWVDPSDWSAVAVMLDSLRTELSRFNVELAVSQDPVEMKIRGYGDILNYIRLRYPAGGFANTCLGHVIGCSPHCDLAEDLKRGINRVLFAPETIEPQGSDKIVCHNCGCGC